MKNYSHSTEISAFLKEIGAAPLFVCDMDGNVMTGYSLANGQTITLKEGDDSQKQVIPFGTSQIEIAKLVEQGVLKTGIFAEKPMDARLPTKLVDFVNESIDAGQPFKIAFLTSRGLNDARKLLEESGVRNIDQVTLVADSGATLYLQGQKTEARTLNESEKLYMSALDAFSGAIQNDVKAVVKAYMGDDTGCPDLFVEHKGIATNLHYREILTHYGQPDNSPLDKALAELLRAKLQTYIEQSEADKSIDQGAFKLLDGPATVEIKAANINKGHGLASIITAAMASDNKPSAIVFTGDDVAKGNGTPGTDYYAMIEAKSFTHKFGIPVHNIHTHHPVNNDIAGAAPDENKSPDTLSAKFDKPKIDLVVPTPNALASIILQANGRGDAQKILASGCGNDITCFWHRLTYF